MSKSVSGASRCYPDEVLLYLRRIGNKKLKITDGANPSVAKAVAAFNDNKLTNIPGVELLEQAVRVELRGGEQALYVPLKVHGVTFPVYLTVEEFARICRQPNLEFVPSVEPYKVVQKPSAVSASSAGRIANTATAGK